MKKPLFVFTICGIVFILVYFGFYLGTSYFARKSKVIIEDESQRANWKINISKFPEITITISDTKKS